jgi:hypothetical protein
MRQLWTRTSRRRFFVVVAALSVITLGASSPIYSAVSGWHVTGHTSASPVATAGPTVSGPCSRAVANRLLKQLHLGPNWPEPNPAAQVLCGAFTGPRSKAMAVTFTLGVCMPTLGWGVFRLTAGKWKLVMTQNGYSTLAAVGTDIRETAPIYRQGDGRCFPSGGRHARIWHWNGARFIASAWKQVTPGKAAAPAGAATSGYFKTPSGNIVCFHSPGPKDYARSAFRGAGSVSGGVRHLRGPLRGRRVWRRDPDSLYRPAESDTNGVCYSQGQHGCPPGCRCRRVAGDGR